jgi:hypothetical protein
MICFKCVKIQAHLRFCPVTTLTEMVGAASATYTAQLTLLSKRSGVSQLLATLSTGCHAVSQSFASGAWTGNLAWNLAFRTWAWESSMHADKLRYHNWATALLHYRKQGVYPVTLHEALRMNYYITWSTVYELSHYRKHDVCFASSFRPGEGKLLIPPAALVIHTCA